MNTSSIVVKIKTLPHFQGLKLPEYETKQSAGMDVRAALLNEGLTIKPGERSLVPTGFCIALPAGFEAQMRPRSGLAIKNGITLLNSPGTIDADYRGEVKVILINHGNEPFTIKHGDRIAQMVIAPVNQAAFKLSDDLENTERGEGGFGSTGKS